MRVAYALICRHLEHLADGTYAVIGMEANVQHAPNFPTQGIVTLLVKIQGNEPEGSDHVLTAKVLAPDLTDATPELSFGFKSANAPLLPAGWETGLLVPMQLVFAVPEPGGYSVELSVDGGGSCTVPFIMFGPPPPQT